MKRIVTLVLAVFFSTSTRAQADPIDTAHALSIEDKLAFCSAGGEGMKMQGTTTSASIVDFDITTGAAIVHTIIEWNGSFGGPYDDEWSMMLFDPGYIDNSFEFFLEPFLWNGTMYASEETMSIYIVKHAGLTEKNGTVFGDINGNFFGFGDGIAPFSTSVDVFYDDTLNPTEWSVIMKTEWVATGFKAIIPSPGTLASLGVLGLLGRRRHRR